MPGGSADGGRRPAVALLLQLLQQHVGDRDREGIVEIFGLRDPHRRQVAAAGIVDPALSHGDLAELVRDQHPCVAAVAEAGQRAFGPRLRAGEFRPRVEGDAQAVLRIAPHQRIDVLRAGDLPQVLQHRRCPRRADGLATVHGEDAPHDALVHPPLVRLALGGGRAPAPLGHGTPGLAGLLQPPGEDQGHAVGQPQPGTGQEDLPVEQPHGGPERRLAVPDPEADRPGVLEDLAGQRDVARLRGVAHGQKRFAAAHQGPGDAAVHLPEPLPRVPVARPRAMLPDERMQPPGLRPVAAHRVQQAGQRLHGFDPAHRVVPSQHVVEQFRVHPLQQTGVEQQLPVAGVDPFPQTRLHPVLDDVAHLRPARARVGARPVAVDAQRHGPSPGILGQRGEPAARQPPVEEIRDLVPGEPQVVHSKHGCHPVEDGAAYIQPRGKAPAGGRQVQVGRSAPEQEFDERDRSAVGQPVQVVEGEHERFAAGFERARQQPDPALGIGAAGRAFDAHSGVLEREGDVGIQDVRVFVAVDGHPCRDDAVFREVAAAFGEQGGLAEAARRQEHRQAVARRHGAIHEPRAVHVSRRPAGDSHLLAKQPGEPRLGIQLPANLRRRCRGARSTRHVGRS